MEILQNIPLAPLTTLGIGGPARYFVEVRTADDAREAALWSREYGHPLFILGGGSNLVIADEGWPGVAARMAIAGIERRRAGGEILYDAGAGGDWDEFVERAVAEECAGVECLSGIPGTVGGTPVQNVGAYGQEVSETIRSVQALDLSTLEFVSLENGACGFGYRGSRFNRADRGRYMILRVVFGLRPGAAPCLRYADLKAHFGGGARPSLAQVRQAVLEIRRRKAMVVEEAEPDSRSAGSFFKNPLITREHYRQIVERYEAKGPFAASAQPDQSARQISKECPPPEQQQKRPSPGTPALTGLRVPCFEITPATAKTAVAGDPGAGDGWVKLPAAWLVEQAGVHRGFQLGRVAVSRKHALALVNRGGATAADLLKLMKLIQAKVREAFAIELEAEPVFVGFNRENGPASPA
jgi:UDP-N-acetylmuramate dehydrogenase